MGPDVEYAAEKPANPIELRVYRGADANFALYEDENDGYDYEKGLHAAVAIRWDNAKQTLTIGERKGRFPGMLETRTFRIVFAGEGHGTGIGLPSPPDKVIQYAGKQVQVAAR